MIDQEVLIIERECVMKRGWDKTQPLLYIKYLIKTFKAIEMFLPVRVV